MQVGLGAGEDRIVGAAVVAAALLPALALVADHPGRHHMLPLDPAGALAVLARLIAAAGQIDTIALIAAAAVEGARVVGVDLPGDLLGRLEGGRRLDIGEDDGEKGRDHQRNHRQQLFGGRVAH
ncbi:hypothetical protein D9M71_599910 [compost metagenome]